MSLLRAQGEAKIIPFPKTPDERAERRNHFEEKRALPEKIEADMVRKLVSTLDERTEGYRGKIIFQIPRQPKLGDVIPDLSSAFGKVAVDPYQIILYSSDRKLGYFVCRFDDNPKFRAWRNHPLDDVGDFRPLEFSTDKNGKIVRIN